jgi:hypothetical protein
MTGAQLVACDAAHSRHGLTQRPLMSCLILRAYLKTMYRGVGVVLDAGALLRRWLGLEDNLPGYTAL